MKLILAITRLDAGGMERFCVTLGNTLAAQGRACLVCALHRAAHGASRDWLSPAVDYVELNRPARFAAPALARLCRRNPEAPVLALGVEIAIVLVALKRLGIVRNRIFYRESTAVPAHCSAFWQWLMARFISRTDGLIVPSRQAMTDLQALFPLRQPVALIRNPCAFARPPGSGPAVFPCRRQNMNVLSVGRLEPMKGHERLIRAWPSVRERFSGARLKIAGQGSLFAALNACVASLKLDACVTLKIGRAHV
jgi:glycosyltransferase involved in cell wall biosynthesis